MKKSYFKKAGTFLLLGMLLGAMPMKSQSLYVYTTSSTTPEQSFLLSDVQEVTFSGSSVVVNPKTGDPVTFATVKFFSLKNFDPTGIAPNKAEVAISVYPNPAVADVTVQSTTTITGVGLYNLQGQKLLQLYPESLEATVPLAAYPAGLYLLQVADESGITIKKVIKN